jgi:hypothetical protein
MNYQLVWKTYRISAFIIFWDITPPWTQRQPVCTKLPYVIQKTLNTNKCTKSFLVNYNTLLHVSTLLGHLQGETFLYRYTSLHYTVERECAVDCTLRRAVYSQQHILANDFTNVKSLSKIRILQLTRNTHNTQPKNMHYVFPRYCTLQRSRWTLQHVSLPCSSVQRAVVI